MDTDFSWDLFLFQSAFFIVGLFLLFFLVKFAVRLYKQLQ